MNYLITFIFAIYTDHLWARSLKATADKLGQETSRIGLALAIFGVVIAGIYFVLGKNDAGQKMTQALLGTIVVVSATSIVNFIQGLA